jgi:hypothetical protein
VVLYLPSEQTGQTMGNTRVNAWLSGYLARSCTDCWQAIGEIQSVCDSMTIQKDYIHTDGDIELVGGFAAI